MATTINPSYVYQRYLREEEGRIVSDKRLQVCRTIRNTLLLERKVTE